MLSIISSLLLKPASITQQKILATAASLSTMSFYSLSAVKGDGESISMEDLKGKVIYATNVASK